MNHGDGPVVILQKKGRPVGIESKKKKVKSVKKINRFKELVLNKFYVYNSLFMNLPYEKVENIGMLIPILYEESKIGIVIIKQYR